MMCFSIFVWSFFLPELSFASYRNELSTVDGWNSQQPLGMYKPPEKNGDKLPTWKLVNSNLQPINSMAPRLKKLRFFGPFRQKAGLVDVISAWSQGGRKSLWPEFQRSPENHRKPRWQIYLHYTLAPGVSTGSGSATMNQEPLVAAGTLATLARQHHAACTKVCATLLSFCHGLSPFGAIGPTLHHRGPALISRKRANYSDQTPAK